MISKTKGIVFHQLKYSETSFIVKIYTQEFGLQSYLIKGARNKKSKIRPALLQHLSLLELIVTHKEKSNLQHIREIRSAHQYSNLPFDMIKSSITLFVNELLLKSIREEEANQALFDYIFQSMQWLDLAASDFVNFHLIFAMQLTRYLGFSPQGIYSPTTPYFDLEEGCFASNRPTHPNYIQAQDAEKFHLLMKLTYDTIGELKLNNAARNSFLNQILNYYQLHLPNFKDLKSLKVLREVLG